MVSILKDTVIVIPTKRLPPIKTLASYPTKREVIILADPSVYDEHKRWIKTHRHAVSSTNIAVVEGAIGMIPQSAECYRQSYKAGYKYYFRMDDDLPIKTFVTREGFPDLEYVMRRARKCAAELGTSLNGFANTSRRDWLNDGYRRTYGLIHGGANLCISSKSPSKFIDENLPAYEDVYRSLAHRKLDGAVGRVAFIGFDKRLSVLNGSLVPKTSRVVEKAKKIILGKFSGMITCNGYRMLGSGHVIANWRFVRGCDFVK